MRPSALRSRSPLDPTAEEEEEEKDDHHDDDEENKALTKDLVASLRDTVRVFWGKLLYFYSLSLSLLRDVVEFSLFRERIFSVM